MIEAEVHQQLRAFLREQGESHWPHHLTMARLVARALRLDRSALIQAGPPAGYYGRYRLSYLMPLLIWPGAAVLVVPEDLQRRLIQVEIPRLRQWISVPKAIHTGDRWPGEGFDGVLLTSPQAWLSDRIENSGRFPLGIPTIFDNADDLETWSRQQLTAQIQPHDWDALMLAYPEHQDYIRDLRVQLTHIIFQHPENPYHCHIIDTPEQQILQELHGRLTHSGSAYSDSPDSDCGESDSRETDAEEINADYPNRQLWSPQQAAMPASWRRFWQAYTAQDHLVWTAIARRQGQFTLCCAPADVSDILAPIWEQQPIVLIGGALDLDNNAPIYRQRLGLGDMTCLKFAPHRQQDLVQLYLPDHLSMPNHPQFQADLLGEIRTLLHISASVTGPTVILLGDMPLKNRMGAALAAEFGSRVKVENTGLDDNGILVTGWDFWREHQGVLPVPSLLIIATLPLPSLEHPLVAGRVAHYKRQHQDWFRLYLLPDALSELQRAIAPLRHSHGVVALLDNRVNHRSYGHQVLSALSPAARTNYVDVTLFDSQD